MWSLLNESRELWKLIMDIKIKGTNQYTKKKMTIKSNYKNTQNKWQENYANWFIELIKKLYFFQKISKEFIKNNFKLTISIYLFAKKKSFNLFSINDLIQFHLCSNFQESYLHLILLKEFIKNNIYI